MLLLEEAQMAIKHRLLEFPGELEGTDWLSKDGNFVREGIAQRLLEADAAEDIQLDFLGPVFLKGVSFKTCIGTLSIPYSSRWAQQAFINTNVLAECDHFVFTAYRCSSFINPSSAERNTSGALILSERQRVGAEIGMCANGLTGYMQVANSIHSDQHGLWSRQSTLENLNLARHLCSYLDTLRRDVDVLFHKTDADWPSLTFGQ